MNLNEPIGYDNPDDEVMPHRESIPSMIGGGVLVLCLVILMLGGTARALMWMFGIDI